MIRRILWWMVDLTNEVHLWLADIAERMEDRHVERTR